ncbi:hypothetical protein [Flavobacterium cellulosilyticum]|uniref:DUF481 domain-containing protein n=1 Tax=Flavobacterium cellulosilyticum TaxID=2541731 RepID=A0A4R5C804_9FLAO|nr:hypothetical protein [Flavobacterium cellulosilyticum]TDD95951.1 hypothetical protein E0F76_12640 [Flavobacterium cellulosilyticum]
MKRITLVALLFIGAFFNVSAQQNDTIQKNNYLRVFLDGASESENYIKVKLWYIDYVRDRKQSQVHIIINSQPTASGGLQYNIRFLGHEKFENKNDTLQYIAKVENSNRENRDELTNVITMGLMPYLASNGQQKYMAFDYTDKTKLVEQSVDKYKNWVYTATANTFLSGDKVSEVLSADGSFSAARITDQWKTRLTAGLSYGSNNYETTTYNFTGKTVIKNLKGLIVKSIDDHWSIGLEPAFYASTYSNVKSQFSIAPGIEYDVFPYSQSVNDLFTFKYRLQPLYNTYIDNTFFNKTKEFLFNQIVDVTYTHIAPWGNISSTLTGSDYLNHAKAYRVDLVNQVNFRVAKGLFFNITGNASLINNQLSLSSVSLTPEQIILKQRETLTNFSYSMQVGVRYTFGSIFNNIVNPRYEGGVTIDNEISTKGETAD